MDKKDKHLREGQTHRVRAIAHDINNALMSCSGALQSIMRSTPEDSPNTAKLRLLLHGLKDASTLVKELFHATKQSELERTQLSEIVSQTTELFREGVREEIKIKTDIECDVIILSDPVKLKRALLNVLTNAQEAIPEHGEISVSLHRDTVQKSAIIKIQDNGMGMSSEILEKISQGRYSTKDASPARGYGMQNIKSIIQEHGGKLEISSTEGNGCMLSLIFPLVENEKSKQETVLLENAQVLLVEVGGKVHSSLRPFLQQADINITSFSNFETAFEWYQSHKEGTALVFLYATSEEDALLHWFPKFQVVDPGKPVLISSPGCSQLLGGMTGRQSLHCVSWPLNYVETTQKISSLLRC